MWFLFKGTSGLGRQVELSYDNTSITIHAFTWSASGQYTCVAANSEDTALASVVVSAQGWDHDASLMRQKYADNFYLN